MGDGGGLAMIPRHWRCLPFALLALAALSCTTPPRAPDSGNAPLLPDPLAGDSAAAPLTGKRLEVRPLEATLPVGRQVLLIATAYDEDNKPRRNRRVEWLIEGPGGILAVDETGFLFTRGKKTDSKSAVSFTGYVENDLPPNIDNPLKQVIRPGQTWCAISSAVEGQTIITAYAPDIGNASVNRVLIRVNWVDARWQLPKSAAARAGTESVLATRIERDTGPASTYRVRYTLVGEGATAALYPVASPRNGMPAEITVAPDSEGVARACLAHLKAEPGSNRVAVEVLRPDPSKADGFVVVARGETRVEWHTPEIKLGIDAPRAVTLQQPFPITYSVSGVGGIPSQAMMVKAAIPPGTELVSTSPKATVDGEELLWSLHALPANQQHTVQAIYRPIRVGPVTAAASVRTSDNLRSDSSASIQVTEARIQVSLTGPQTALVGEKLPFQITVKNPGSGPATNVRVKARFDASLEVVNRPGPFETLIDRLDAGQEQAIALPLMAQQSGKSAVKVSAVADGSLQAESPSVGIDVRKPELKVEAYSPERGYLNQDVTWTLRVFNLGDVPLGNVVVRALLPPEVTFKSATLEGRHANNVVEWNLGTAVGKQWADLQVTVTPVKLGRAVVTGTVTADPLANRGGEFQQVSMIKPLTAEKALAAVEILGIPALQLEVFDSADPVVVGQKLTYTIRVKNAGTLPAGQVEIAADLPPQIRPLRAFGLSAGRIDGQRVAFPPIDSIRPGIVSVFTVEAEAVSEGDGRFRAEVKSLSLGSPIRSEEATRVLKR